MVKPGPITGLLHIPWVIALAFAPFALAVWAFQTGAFDLDAATRSQALEATKLAMLLVGAALYWRAVRGKPASYGVKSRLWAWAALAGFGAILAQYASAEAGFGSGLEPVSAAARLAHLVIFVALAEEIWFRGLWMRATADNVLLAIGLGSLAFGLLHWPAGLGQVATTAAIGALYGAARWRGAPLWSLALAHGLVNWIAGTIAPASTWRTEPWLAQALFCVIALIFTWVIVGVGRRSKKDKMI